MPEDWPIKNESMEFAVLAARAHRLPGLDSVAAVLPPRQEGVDGPMGVINGGKEPFSRKQGAPRGEGRVRLRGRTGRFDDDLSYHARGYRAEIFVLARCREDLRECVVGVERRGFELPTFSPQRFRTAVALGPGYGGAGGDAQVRGCEVKVVDPHVSYVSQGLYRRLACREGPGQL